MDKKFFHKLDEEEYTSLMSKEPSIEEILDNFKAPDWCSMEDALDPLYGCEELTNPESRVDICRSFCKSCPYFNKHLGIFGV